MGFSSLLKQIKKGSPPSELPSTPEYGYKEGKINRPPSHRADDPAYDNFSTRAVDPAVQRLKEARRLQKEKEETERKLKGNATKRRTPQSSRPKSETGVITRKANERASNPKLQRQYQDQQQKNHATKASTKKLSYAELMAAAKQKTKKLEETSKSVSPPTNEVSQTPERTGYQSKSVTLRKQPPQRSDAQMHRKTEHSGKASSYAPPRPKIAVAGPKPLAKPSAKLQAKLDMKNTAVSEHRRLQKRRHLSNLRDDDYGDSEEELSDDFIVDDDEEEHGEASRNKDANAGYDKEEIWSLFSRGKPRRDYRDYEDDLSDMEATGLDVEREERLAAKRAKQEDLEEQERERKHREEKKRRLGR